MKTDLEILLQVRFEIFGINLPILFCSIHEQSSGVLTFHYLKISA